MLHEEAADLESANVGRGLAADFIAYSLAPSGVCYLLPVMPLQRACRQYGREWIKEYGQRRAQNPGYVSVSVPLPKTVLMWAIVDVMKSLVSSRCATVRLI